MGNYEYEPIKKLKENNKKKMIFMFLTMFMFLGISLATIYFVYRYSDERENTITSGLVDIDFKEKGASINLENTVPMTDETGKKNDPYIFTVENTSKIPVNLKISLEIGTNTIDLSAIKYALYLNNEEIKVDNLENLDSENNLYIKEQFASGAKVEVKLVFWIDYYYEKSGGTFSANIKVEGEQYDIIVYEPTGAETIKETIGKSGGVIGVTNDGEPTTSEGNNIREYRYSGSSVNNYVTFNEETWRIIGVFKDENGEHLKIVRDNVLTSDKFPETYIIEGTTFKIKYSSDSDYAYRNYNQTLGEWKSSNDWSTSGLQYWLNTETDDNSTSQGYLSFINENSKNMIAETKYYLGVVIYKEEENSMGIIDTPKEAYENEMAFSGCEEGVGPDSNSDQSAIEANKNCRVWAGNKAIWIGKIALLYPSDYGFSVGIENWKTQLREFNAIKSLSWLNSANHIDNEWFLSPSSRFFSHSSYWHQDGYVHHSRVNDFHGVRPTLYLKSNVKINGGIGTQDSPYTLIME